MIGYLWNDIVHGTTRDKVTASFVLIICLLVFFFVGGVFVAVLDSSGRSTRSMKAQYTSRSYTLEWLQTTTIVSAGVPVTQIIQHPESWSLSVITEEGDALECPTTERTYHNVEKDSVLVIHVTSGLLTDSLYCKGALLDQ